MKSKKYLLAFAIAAASLSAMADNQVTNILSLKETITDDAIIFPESTETDTKAMMQNWYLRNYAELDANADERAVTEVSDEEIARRLAAMPTVIEMPFNSVVRKYIDLYTTKRRSLIENMLGMSLYYMPIFEQALEREGLPLELKYLPVIESALNPDAVSRAGATGLWQFMLPTARGLGMEVNSLVDERRDPIKSSEMAARYLHQLYDIYNDWSLAIAAYNCGPGNINKAIRRAGSGKKDFWDIYYLLPAETRGYVPCFIAANYAMTYYGKHNISPALARKPIITDTVTVTHRVHFDQISEVLNIPVEGIKVLNPQFRENIIPGDIKPYALTLPSQQIYSYIISEDSILAHNADLYARRMTVEPNDGSTPSMTEDNTEWETAEVVKWHKVKKGETFSSIAKKYGVTVASIKNANGISTLRRGRSIKIVTTEKVAKSKDEVAPDTTPTPEANDPNLRQLASDEELQQVTSTGETFAQTPVTTESTDTTMPAVESAAEVVNETPTPAPEPKKQTTKKKTQSSKTYTVKSGDTLSKIARKHGTTVKKLQQLNGISGSNIQPGQKLKVS